VAFDVRGRFRKKLRINAIDKIEEEESANERELSFDLVAVTG